jgi:G:T-mismatch repair DNA endonuclease (very short patch repair protein)
MKAMRGVAIFAKACFGHPSPSKQQKLNATRKNYYKDMYIKNITC